MSITNNIPEFKKYLGAFKGSAGDALAEKVAKLYESQLMLNSPVDTGNLRSNWKTEAYKQRVWDVYNNTEYILHLEYGTRFSKKHVGFARLAVSQTRREAEALIIREIKKRV